MTAHAWYECGKPCDGCQYCDGGLASCTVCGGGEGSLPTECPGRPMTDAEEEDVYAGRLDFRAGEWRAEASGGVASHLIAGERA